MLDELKAAEVEKAEKEKKLKEEEDKEVTDEVEEKSKTKEKEKENGKSRHDARDWKRNGLFVKKNWDVKMSLTSVFLDERWLEWLDSKIALLINRDGVDPHIYGGKSYEE
jgi:hypothetical protein